MDPGVPDACSSVADHGLQKFNDIQKNPRGNPIEQKRSGACAAVTDSSAEVIEVVFDATKEIRKHALEWTLDNVIVQSGGYITLLAVVPNTNTGIFSSFGKWNKLNLAKRRRECTKLQAKSWAESKEKIKSSCKQIIQEVQKTCDEKKVHTRVKVIRAETSGFAAVEAAKKKATWVVLDRHLKKEGKFCVEKLQCNVVVVNYFDVCILRMNLKRSPEREKNDSHLENLSSCTARARERKYGPIERIQMRTPEIGNKYTSAELGTHLNTSSATDFFSASGLDAGTDAGRLGNNVGLNFMEEVPPSGEISERNRATSCFKDGSGSSNFDNDSKKATSIENQETTLRNLLSNSKDALFTLKRELLPNKHASKAYSKRSSMHLGKSSHALKTEIVRRVSTGERLLRRTCLPPQDCKSSSRYRLIEFKLQSKELKIPLIASITSTISRPGKMLAPSDLFALINNKREDTPDKRSLIEGILEKDLEAQPDPEQDRRKQEKLDRSPSLRSAVLFSEHASPDPPPLCSICQHKSPQFYRSAHRFSYVELQSATNGFSKENFLADEGSGSVHQGVLPDGQMVAVKQCTLTGSQDDIQFCSEAEALSCAHHRNVVPLIGYCIEDHARFLVYEFVCNGSLDSHLYGQNKPLLEWKSRKIISVGAARGLRYLHEESRVGCVIHQHMRPNNILLTHDFEPMVGGFELARWQPDEDFGVETTVHKIFGCLSPESALNDQITVKADVLSFGVVLLEIATGKKAIDFSRPKGQHYLTEWARPLLEAQRYDELADLRLENSYNDYEMHCMLYTAYLCISPDPLLRPRMSQVVRMLEGDVFFDISHSP